MTAAPHTAAAPALHTPQRRGYPAGHRFGQAGRSSGPTPEGPSLEVTAERIRNATLPGNNYWLRRARLDHHITARCSKSTAAGGPMRWRYLRDTSRRGWPTGRRTVAAATRSMAHTRTDLRSPECSRSTAPRSNAQRFRSPADGQHGKNSFIKHDGGLDAVVPGVPRALSSQSNDGSAIPAGSPAGQGGAVSYLAAVIGPLQQRLSLPGPTKSIAWFAIRSHLRNVAAK